MFDYVHFHILQDEFQIHSKSQATIAIYETIYFEYVMIVRGTDATACPSTILF